MKKHYYLWLAQLNLNIIGILNKIIHWLQMQRANSKSRHRKLLIKAVMAAKISTEDKISMIKSFGDASSTIYE